MPRIEARCHTGENDEVIAYICRDSLLGKVMLAASDKGICFLQFADDKEALLCQLQLAFPLATLTHSDLVPAPLSDWGFAFDDYVGGHTTKPDLPLDMRGTAFQKQVWQFLISLNDGDVLSYSELAKQLGKPKAVRAVASACAKNQIAVLIPCHRILRADGGLGGYRWGLERKKVLLNKEREQ